MKNSKTNKTVQYLIAVIIYGTIGFFSHYVNAPSEFIVMCRGLIGSLFILLIMLIKKELPNLKAIKKNLLYLAISGIGLGLNWIFLFSGYKYSISISSLCNYTAPITIILISAFYLKAKISRKQLICIVSSFVGIVLLSGVLENQNGGDNHAFVYGLLASFGFVLLVLFNRKLKGIKPLDRTIVQLFISFLTVLPYVLINHSIPNTLDKNSIILVLVLGIVHTGIAYILYFSSIDTLDVTKVAVLGYIEPVLSVLTGVIFFKETLGIYGLFGAILILVSAIISETSTKSS